MVTAREPNELLVEARIPLLGQGATFGFYEFNRRAGDFALGCALRRSHLRMASCRTYASVLAVSRARLAVSAVEDLLEGREPSAAAFHEAAAAAHQGLDPMEDPATNAEYRRGLAPVVIRRALHRAANNLGINV